MKKYGMLVIQLVFFSFVSVLSLGEMEKLDASEFPTKPIEMIVPAPAGGGTDIIARLIGEAVEKELKQKIVVINTPGASGTLGMNQIVKSRADGYSLGCTWQAPMTMVPNVLKVDYNPDSFSYISLVSTGANLFAVRSDFSAKTAEEFFTYAQNNLGKVTYGNEGIGNTAHFAGEKVFQAKKVQLRMVPYGGSAEIMSALLGGHIDVYGGSVLAAGQQIQAGAVRGIFVTTYERVKSLPNIPGIKDLNLPKEVETLVWRGIVGPKGIPAERMAILEKAFQKAARSQKVTEFLEKQGDDIIASSSEDFEKRVRLEFKTNASVAKEIGLSAK
jgi:tripartite-type tricarboxylate transporter receptor subunit TctC